MGITSKHVKRSLSNSPQLTFEIADVCNLKCEYCGYGKSYSDNDERRSTRLSPQRAKALLDYLSSLWGLNLMYHIIRMYTLASTVVSPL